MTIQCMQIHNLSFEDLLTVLHSKLFLQLYRAVYPISFQCSVLPSWLRMCSRCKKLSEILPKRIKIHPLSWNLWWVDNSYLNELWNNRGKVYGLKFYVLSAEKRNELRYFSTYLFSNIGRYLCSHGHISTSGQAFWLIVT